MAQTTRVFGWITVVTVLHMVEQLKFGLVELQRLKLVIGVYVGWFANADTAIVVLVTIAVGLIYLAMFGMLAGGWGRFAALEVLGAFSALEVHHVIETILARGYTPGLITSIPYVLLGVQLMRLAHTEYRSKTTGAVPQTAALPLAI